MAVEGNTKEKWAKSPCRILERCITGNANTQDGGVGIKQDNSKMLNTQQLNCQVSFPSCMVSTCYAFPTVGGGKFGLWRYWTRDVPDSRNDTDWKQGLSQSLYIKIFPYQFPNAFIHLPEKISIETDIWGSPI